MKTYDRELELGFEVSAAKAMKIITREKLFINHKEIIHQMWLEEGFVGDYKFRTRIRDTMAVVPNIPVMIAAAPMPKYEFTTKYSKNDESATEQDNMELNATISQQEYDKLLRIYKPIGKEEVVKVRIYFSEPQNPHTVYTIDTYPYENNDRARIEIEFSTEEQIKQWKAPSWFKELIDNKKA